MSKELLADIEAFLKRTKMGSTYFGKKAVGNAELVKRLRKGRQVLTGTADQVRAFIASHTQNEPDEPADRR